MNDYSKLSNVIDGLRNRLVTEEGKIPWLYLDTAGVVTVGVGHAVRSADECAALPWQSRYAADLLRSEYRSIQSLIPADRGMLLRRGAHFYAGVTTCRLISDEISSVLYADIYKFIPQIEKVLPAFAELPEGPQQAILDMCFNLGTHGFAKGFPHCFECVRNRDFTGAAASCRRRAPISDERNKRTAELFCKGIEITAAGTSAT